MATFLRVDSGAAHPGSVTRALAGEVIAQLGGAGAQVVHRDLSLAVPAVVTADWMAATRGAGASTPAQLAALAESDGLIDEVLAADVLVITAPIYNFSIPAALKLWIDQIARAGRTFRYSEAGPVGLLVDKRAVLVVASGGVPVGSPADFGSAYLRHVLGFLGIGDVHLVAAERTAFSLDDSMLAARAQIAALTL